MTAAGLRPSAHLVYTLLGSVLLLAAALKLWELLEGTWTPLLGSSWLPVLIVQYEVFLGAWLLTGAFPRTLRCVCSLAFLAFAGVSVATIAAGAESCGCFGPLEISPWWSLFIDTMALALLAAQCQPSECARPTWGDLILPVVLSLMIGVIGSKAVDNTAPLDFSSVEPGQRIILRPEDWVGRPFPLFPFLDTETAQRLAAGDWTVLVFNRSCGKCRKVVRWYDALADASGKQRTAFIEVPPIEGEPLAILDGRLVSKLDSAYRWFVAFPAEVILSEGRVVSGRSRVAVNNE